MKRLAFVLAVQLAACGSSSGTGGDGSGLTARGCDLPGVDSRCGSQCSGSFECGSALFCGSSGVCEAECVPSGAGCASGQICVQARCVGGALDGGSCPRVDVVATPLIPTVLLLIDQSGSMNDDFNGVPRWTALKTALTDPAVGVLPALETKVRFGAALYTSDRGGPTCPDLTQEAPALNNGAHIKALLDGNFPMRDTPTGEAIEAVVPGLKASAGFEGAGPLAIVLATDGEPDTCAVPNPTTPAEIQAAKDVSVAAARSAYSRGVKTYVLSVGSEIGQAHLQDMANAGAGVNPGEPNAKYFVANSPSELVAAFNNIVRGARSCVFTLNTTVRPGSEGGARINLNGQPVPLNDPNGWRLVDASTVELLGGACDAFKNSDTATLTGSFPCRSNLN